MSSDDPLTLEAAAAQLQDGDVLVFRTTEVLSMADQVRIAQLAERWVEQLPVTVYPLLLHNGLTLETIPADRMRQLGWVRADALLVDLEV